MQQIQTTVGAGRIFIDMEDFMDVHRLLAERFRGHNRLDELIVETMPAALQLWLGWSERTRGANIATLPFRTQFEKLCRDAVQKMEQP